MKFPATEVKAVPSTIEEPWDLFLKHLKLIEIQMLRFSSYTLDFQVL